MLFLPKGCPVQWDTMAKTGLYKMETDRFCFTSVGRCTGVKFCRFGARVFQKFNHNETNSVTFVIRVCSYSAKLHEEAAKGRKGKYASRNSCKVFKNLVGVITGLIQTYKVLLDLAGREVAIVKLCPSVEGWLI